MAVRIGQLQSKDLFTIPNIITYFRILCIPAFVILMAFAGVKDSFLLLYIALGVFVLAAVSDLFDGWIARRFNMQSGVGMALDPVADKAMHIAVLLCLALCTGLTPLGKNLVGKEVIPGIVVASPWFVHYGFVIAIFAKELVQVFIAIYVLRKGVSMKANWLGKVSSFTISLGVILGFFHQYVGYADWGILAWGIVMSYAAAFNYLADVIKQVKRIDRGEQEIASPESVKEADMKTVRAKKDGTYSMFPSEDISLKNVVSESEEMATEASEESATEKGEAENK